MVFFLSLVAASIFAISSFHFVWFRFDSFRFLFDVFVLHVVVSFSPLVYNFNKILLTNSGEWSAESAMTGQGEARNRRAAQTRPDCTDRGHFYTSARIDIIITITVAPEAARDERYGGWVPSRRGEEL